MATRDDINTHRMHVAEGHLRFAVDAIEIQMDHDALMYDDTAPRDIAFARYLLVCDVDGDEHLSVHDDLEGAHDAATRASTRGARARKVIDLDVDKEHLPLPTE